MSRLTTVIMVITLLTFSNALAIDAEKILKLSDIRRGGFQASGITWVVNVDSVEGDTQSSRSFLVKSRDNNSYVEATSPARNKGEVYIFNDRNIWFYKPSLKKPISISARQRLSGQAANGDIASTNYARDYSASLEKTEEINGDKVFVLILKAKYEDLTYDKIRYWISSKGYYALKAEFLTMEGEPFKVAQMEYRNKVVLGGKQTEVISKLTIQDAKFEKNKSVLSYINPKIQKHDLSIFNVNNLSR